MARYRNPWHNPHDKTYGPEFYEAETRPTEYKGFEIYQRHSGCFDVVVDNECKTQMAGINGAKQWIDREAEVTQ